MQLFWKRPAFRDLLITYIGGQVFASIVWSGSFKGQGGVVLGNLNSSVSKSRLLLYVYICKKNISRN